MPLSQVRLPGGEGKLERRKEGKKSKLSFTDLINPTRTKIFTRAMKSVMMRKQIKPFERLEFCKSSGQDQCLRVKRKSDLGWGYEAKPLGFEWGRA